MDTQDLIEKACLSKYIHALLFNPIEGKNIIWACSSYECLGADYQPNQPIKENQVKNIKQNLSKTHREQKNASQGI